MYCFKINTSLDACIVQFNLKINFYSFWLFARKLPLTATSTDLLDVHSDARRTKIWEPLDDSQGLGTRAVSNGPSPPALPRKRVQIVLQRMCELRYRSLFPSSLVRLDSHYLFSSPTLSVLSVLSYIREGRFVFVHQTYCLCRLASLAG